MSWNRGLEQEGVPGNNISAVVVFIYLPFDPKLSEMVRFRAEY